MIDVDTLHNLAIIAVGGKLGKPFDLSQQLLSLQPLEGATPIVRPSAVAQESGGAMALLKEWARG